MIPTRERCAACQQISPVGFHVPDDLWRAVVHPSLQDSVLCLICFVSRADEKLIAWDREIELHPVSLATHIAHVRALNVPDWRVADDQDGDAPDEQNNASQNSGASCSDGAAEAGGGAPEPASDPPSADLTTRERAVLKALHRLAKRPERPSLSEVARTARVSTGSISYLCQRLTDKGLARREGPPGAYRFIPVELPSPPDPEPEELSPKPAQKRRANERTRPFRRFDDKPALDPETVKGLAEEHPAATEGRTIFPTTVVDPRASPRLLVSGGNSRKLGDRVTKGPWAEMPIYQLTLEERATCPRSCHHWSTCYGNGMPRARRHRHGTDLELGLERELRELQRQHPDGFVVRLHVLGDFYSGSYCAAWAHWLSIYPALRVFGFTAWPRSSEIGKQLRAIIDHHGFERFAIRFSSDQPQAGGVTTIWQQPDDAEIDDSTIICPAQTGGTDCCGSCGLCWSPAAKDKTIAFVAHGGLGKRAGTGQLPLTTKTSKPELPADNRPAQNPWPAERQTARPHADEAPEQHKPLNPPVDRRCQGCGEIFKAKAVAELFCGACAASPEIAQLQDRERQRGSHHVPVPGDNFEGL